MIVRIVRMTFQQGQLEAFEALFLQHREAIDQQPGCLGVEWITDPEAPFVRGTLSRWESTADLDAYRQSALFGMIWPTTKAMFSQAPQVWTYHVLSLTSDSHEVPRS